MRVPLLAAALVWTTLAIALLACTQCVAAQRLELSEAPPRGAVYAEPVTVHCATEGGRIVADSIDATEILFRFSANRCRVEVADTVVRVSIAFDSSPFLSGTALVIRNLTAANATSPPAFVSQQLFQNCTECVVDIAGVHGDTFAVETTSMVLDGSTSSRFYLADWSCGLDDMGFYQLGHYAKNMVVLVSGVAHLRHRSFEQTFRLAEDCQATIQDISTVGQPAEHVLRYIGDQSTRSKITIRRWRLDSQSEAVGADLCKNAKFCSIQIEDLYFASLTYSVGVQVVTRLMSNGRNATLVLRNIHRATGAFESMCVGTFGCNALIEDVHTTVQSFHAFGLGRTEESYDTRIVVRRVTNAIGAFTMICKFARNCSATIEDVDGAYNGTFGLALVNSMDSELVMRNISHVEDGFTSPVLMCNRPRLVIEGLYHARNVFMSDQDTFLYQGGAGICDRFTSIDKTDAAIPSALCQFLLEALYAQAGSTNATIVLSDLRNVSGAATMNSFPLRASGARVTIANATGVHLAGLGEKFGESLVAIFVTGNFIYDPLMKLMYARFRIIYRGHGPECADNPVASGFFCLYRDRSVVELSNVSFDPAAAAVAGAPPMRGSFHEGRDVALRLDGVSCLRSLDGLVADTFVGPLSLSLDLASPASGDGTGCYPADRALSIAWTFTADPPPSIHVYVGATAGYASVHVGHANATMLPTMLAPSVTTFSAKGQLRRADLPDSLAAVETQTAGVVSVSLDDCSLPAADDVVHVARLFPAATRVSLLRTGTRGRINGTALTEAIGPRTDAAFHLYAAADATGAPSSANTGVTVDVRCGSRLPVLHLAAGAVAPELRRESTSVEAAVVVGPYSGAATCRHGICGEAGGGRVPCTCRLGSLLDLGEALQQPQCASTLSTSASVSESGGSPSASGSESGSATVTASIPLVRLRPVVTAAEMRYGSNVALRILGGGTDGAASAAAGSSSVLEVSGAHFSEAGVGDARCRLRMTADTRAAATLPAVDEQDALQVARREAHAALQQWVLGWSLRPTFGHFGLVRVALPERAPSSVAELLEATPEPVLLRLHMNHSACFDRVVDSFMPEDEPSVRVTFKVVHPPPNVYPPALQGSVATAAVASGVLGSPGSAVYASRASALSRIAACAPELDETLATADSPTRLAVTSDPTRYHFGALVGNFVIILGAAVANLGVPQLRRSYYQSRLASGAYASEAQLPWGTRSPLAAAAWGRFPSLLVFPLLFFAQPCVTSAIAVVAYGETPWARIVAFASLMGWAALVYPGLAPLGLIPGKGGFGAKFVFVTEEEKKDDGLGEGIVARVFRPTGEWADKKRTASKRGRRRTAAEKDRDSNFVRRHFLLFGDFNERSWYFVVVDMGFVAVLSFLVVLAEVGGCAGLAWVTVVVLGAYLVVLAARRPFVSHFNLGITAVLASLQMASAVVVALRADLEDDDPVAVRLNFVADALANVTAGFVMVRALYDTGRFVAMYVIKKARWLAASRSAGGGNGASAPGAADMLADAGLLDPLALQDAQNDDGDAGALLFIERSAADDGDAKKGADVAPVTDKRSRGKKNAVAAAGESPEEMLRRMDAERRRRRAAREKDREAIEAYQRAVVTLSSIRKELQEGTQRIAAERERRSRRRHEDNEEERRSKSDSANAPFQAVDMEEI